MADRIQHARDTLANWQSENPVLLEGEIGIVTDNPGLWKWGNGVTRWNSLPWCGFNGTVAQTTGSSTLAVMSQKAVTDAIAAMSSLEFVVVNSLPTASASTVGKIYLTPSAGSSDLDAKDSWITIHDDDVYRWEKIGTTSIDLSNYPTISQMNEAIEDAIEDISVDDGEFYYN